MSAPKAKYWQDTWCVSGLCVSTSTHSLISASHPHLQPRCQKAWMMSQTTSTHVLDPALPCCQRKGRNKSKWLVC